MTTATKQKQPPRLGDLTIKRDLDRWAVYRAGELVATGLTHEQVLAIIRGELEVAHERG